MKGTLNKKHEKSCCFFVIFFYNVPAKLIQRFVSPLCRNGKDPPRTTRLCAWFLFKGSNNQTVFIDVIHGFLMWLVSPFYAPKYGTTVAGWWFGCHFLFSQKYWVSNHPNWRSHIFQDGVALAHQVGSIGRWSESCVWSLVKSLEGHPDSWLTVFLRRPTSRRRWGPLIGGFLK